MWKRIVYAEWTDVVPYIAFFLTFGVFLVLAVRALTMRKRHARRMANLPLEDPPDQESRKDGEALANSPHESHQPN